MGSEVVWIELWMNSSNVNVACPDLGLLVRGCNRAGSRLDRLKHRSKGVDHLSQKSGLLALLKNSVIRRVSLASVESLLPEKSLGRGHLLACHSKSFCIQTGAL